MLTAILIIDMLNDFFLDGRLKDRRKELCEKMNNLIDWGRQHNLKVIWVRQEFKEDLSDAFLSMRKKGIRKTIEKTEGSLTLEELKPTPDDITIIKKRYSAFYKTNLEEILNEVGIEQLILCGINTHACVRMTAIDAFQRDFEIVIATDCVESYDEEHHRISLRYLRKEIARLLDNGQIMKENFA
jgi:bifunctional isochorismate lyase/aryl carrier protein